MLQDAIEKSLKELLEYKRTNKTDSEMLSISVTIVGAQAIMLRTLKEAVKGHGDEHAKELFKHILNAGIERVHEALLETMLERSLGGKNND